MEDEKPYVVLSPTKIWLGSEARSLCRLHQISEEQMARHLLRMEKLRASGMVQRDGEN
jgi:hypothetical protein